MRGVVVACSILCTSAECVLDATIAFCGGFINVFYPELPPIPLLLVCSAFHSWQGSAQLIHQTSYVLFSKQQSKHELPIQSSDH